MLTKKEWEYACFGRTGQAKHTLPVQIDSNCRLVIYGAGYCGLMFLELLRSRGIEPECFLDMSPQKQGRKIMGVCVHEPNRVWIEDATVVVCLLKMEDTYQQIKARLMEMGCRAVFHFAQRPAALLQMWFWGILHRTHWMERRWLAVPRWNNWRTS